MTICLAIKCQQIKKGKKIPCVLFAADTQESSMIIKRSTTKLRLIFGETPKQGDEWSIMAASSGDAMVVDETLDEIGDFLYDKLKPKEETPSICLHIFRREIGDIAYKVYKKYKDRDCENPEFELLLGAADQFANILHVTYEGKSQLFEEFGIIGSGRVTGGELLLTEFLKKDMNVDEAAQLATLVISVVGHVDMFVGGGPDMATCSERRVWNYEEESYRQILRESKSKWDLMKKSWAKMQMDDSLERKLRKLLKK
ncbi:MAG TPA: hypothetical protein VMS94_04335 [Acidobacteriota bacterium]|nr:hypothetical protein [Acidobacteriota bacterium]